MARKIPISRRLEPVLLSVGGAREIIDVTVLRMRSAPKRLPTPDEVVLETEKLIRELDLRSVVHEMPTLKTYGLAFAKLHSSAIQLSNCLESILLSHPLSYFLLVANTSGKDGPDAIELKDELHKVSVLARLAGECASNAKKEVASAERLGSRWVDLGNETPRAWLYGRAIPDLFGRLFGEIYKISKNPNDTSPGRRFAVALLTQIALAPPSPGELDHYVKERRKQER